MAGSVFAGLASSQPSGHACGGACTDSSIVDGTTAASLIGVGVVNLAVGVPMLAVGEATERNLEHRDVAVYGAVAPREDGAAATLSLAW